MSEAQRKQPEVGVRRLAGVLFVLGAVLVNVPYAVLVATFDYPDVLRAPAGDVLTRFAAGGPALILTWLAFAWAGFPLLFAVLLLPRALAPPPEAASPAPVPALEALTFVGATALVVQMVGLLRWVFVVPVLAQAYTAPAAGGATRDAAAVVFQAVHQYGGVALGEHLGQALTVLWTALLSWALLRARRVPAWLGGLGLGAALVYALAQGELLATVIPGFPQWGLTGLLGSLLWLAWLLALGVWLLRTRPLPTRLLAPSDT